MKKYQNLSAFYVRLSLSVGFLSAVASRLGLLGKWSSGWSSFLTYSAQVNSFAPSAVIPALSITSTVLEASFGILLLLGYKTRWVATASACLTFIFALAMSWSLGIKEPLDYSVFAFSAAGFLLATMPVYKWSIDELITKQS